MRQGHVVEGVHCSPGIVESGGGTQPRRATAGAVGSLPGGCPPVRQSRRGHPIARPWAAPRAPPAGTAPLRASPARLRRPRPSPRRRSPRPGAPPRSLGPHRRHRPPPCPGASGGRRTADGGPHPLTTLEWSPGETVDDHLLITPPDHLAHNMQYDTPWRYRFSAEYQPKPIIYRMEIVSTTNDPVTDVTRQSS
ncbi:hypothetical protein HMPREF1317_0506 [Schaalia georgiae F0490]|uniref:Uncharacterized protein n=1 Tax=Schaalia georgiae F0490 TaxID=1125717 RepID=J1HQK2_9ACTO|nr:hypothetical protein HMPREF1317_0506 [Schaalia georgiae F0490]